MAKKRGIEFKLYTRHATPFVATPANIPSSSGFTERKAVNIVEHDNSPAETTVQTREQEADEVIFASEDVSKTIRVYLDPADPLYLILENARVNRTPIAMIFSSGSLVNTEVVECGNWLVGQQTYSEDKQTAVLVSFTVKPASPSYYRKFVPSVP